MSISYNPPGDGTCQFATMAHHRSVRSLRQEVIKYLKIHVALSNSEKAVPWNSSIEEPRMQYLRRINLNEQFGDHITLQAMYEMIVVSTLTHGTALIRPDGSSQVSDDQACVVLGHMHECNGEHYECLEANRDDLRDVVTESQQIAWTSSNESDVHSGLLPRPEANNADRGDEGLVGDDCQHTDEVIDDVPDDDDIDLVSSLLVIPNEI